MQEGIGQIAAPLTHPFAVVARAHADIESGRTVGVTPAASSASSYLFS